MFDRHLHLTERGSQYVTVTEKRAPTDESVRLLKEMEQAARDKIVQSIRLENCLIDCVIHWQDDFMNGQRDYRILTMVNGRRIEVRKSYDEFLPIEDVAIKLRDELAARIASDLLGKAFAGLDQKLRR